MDPITMKSALITGITGQDGSYLADLLLEKNYIVHGIIRRSSSFNTKRIDHLYQDQHSKNARLFLHYGDLADSSRMVKLLYNLNPDEIYHLGAQSHVRVSFDIPEYTGDVTGLATLRILEAIRESGLTKKSVSIKHHPRKCLGRSKKCLSQKKRHFILARPTLVQKFMLIG